MTDAEPQTTLEARVERRLPEIYLLVGGLLCALLCILTPPFFAPDEPHQAARAISIAHGSVMAQPSNDDAGAPVDRNALRVMDGMDDIRESAERRVADLHDWPWGPVPEPLQSRLNGIRWNGQTLFAYFANTAVYPPLLYLPSTAGWRAAEARDLTIFNSLRLARLLSAITAVGLGWMALRLCAGWRWPLFAYLLLPSTLFLNASCSQDAVLLSVGAVLVALLSRPLAERRELTSAELCGMAVALALCGTARPPYSAVALVLFIPGAELRSNNRKQWLAAGTALAAVMTVCALWRHLVLPLGLDIPDPADPATQMRFIHAHPLRAGWYVLHGTWIAALDFLHRGLYVIGWNHLLAPSALRATLAICLLGIACFAPTIPLRTWTARVLLAAVVLLPLLGISLAEFIIWTPPADPVLYGVQPRYWLPLLPFAMILLRSIVPSAAPARTQWLTLAPAAALVAVACTLPWVVAHAFYMDSVGHVLRLNLP